MKVQSIRRSEPATATKLVAANQEAINAVELRTGVWKVGTIPGLYLRARAASRSFFLQRRVRGHLVNQTLGPLSMKAARAAATKAWNEMKPKPAPGSVVTLEAAFTSYMEDTTLANSTAKNYRYNFARYLSAWKARGLPDVGNDRAGVRDLQRHVRKHHGAAASNQVVRLLSAVYNWARKENPLLPEAPTAAVEVDKIEARNWAYTSDELKAWWSSTVEVDDKLVKCGVSTLGPIKRMWWLTALLTGARRGSVASLRWEDVDFEKRVIKFTVTKGDRPYTVPMADLLMELLVRYRDSGDVEPSEWIFPSPTKPGTHIVDVRNEKQGVGPAHRLRHSFRTALAQLGASPDQARMLLGHSMGGDISRGYISAPLVTESLRPVTNAVAAHYAGILPMLKVSSGK